MATVKCYHCRKSLPKTDPRVGIERGWICEDCAYLIERPNAERIEPAPKVDRLHPQRETLFGGHS